MLGSHAFINTVLSQSTPVLNFQCFELLATNGAFALSGSCLSKHQVKVLPASVTGRTSVLHFLYVYIQGKIIFLNFLCISPLKSKLKFFFKKKKQTKNKHYFPKTFIFSLLKDFCFSNKSQPILVIQILFGPVVKSNMGS